MTVIDLFAGAGGWDIAAREYGIEPLGIELDRDACNTRRAAGLPTLEADILTLDPADFGDVTGLIASPPCQTFSTAGKGAGRKALDDVLRLVDEVACGHRPDLAAAFRPQAEHDPRTLLVLEPLHWALELEPDWIALEQVPPVLPVWQAYADVLRADGYHVACGLLQAEQYGVPQTRKRAILLAARQPVALPTPTHSRYYSRDPKRLDDGVFPWVSMAEALGWGCTDKPSPPVMTARGRQSGADVLRGSGWRGEWWKCEVERPEFIPQAMRSNYGTGGDPAARGERTLDQPAPAVTSKIDRNLWRFAGAGQTSEQTAGQIPRDLDQPAHTIAGKGTAAWVHERPATPVAGDSRIPTPGYKCRGGDCHPGRAPESHMNGAIRVTQAEAAVLQSFPADYPWQGTKTSQFRQIGNACPPLLARAVLAAVLSAASTSTEAAA